MKAHTEETKIEKKKGILKNKIDKKRSIEDDGIVKKKKKFKKNKKAKKNESVTEKIEEAEEQSIEEEIEDDCKDSEDKIKGKKPSKRQLKREKAELRATEAKETSKLEAAQKALNYVSKWKHAKDQWKFNKVIQIWLIDNLLNDKYIPNDHFQTVLEYFEGCKGAARKQLVDKAMAVVKKIEDSLEEDEEAVETTDYNRARQLLQTLPTDT